MEDKIRKIAQQVYSQQSGTQQFSTAKTPFHTHNGVDSPKVNEKDIVSITNSILNAETKTSEPKLVVNTLNGITKLSLHAIAANGVGQDVTLKASISGNAQFGRCYIYNWQGNSTNIPNTSGQFEQFTQSCNYTYLDTTTLANVRVGAAGDSLLGGPTSGYLLYVADNTGTVVASIQITAWTGNTISFNVYVATYWYIKWFLTMS